VVQAFNGDEVEEDETDAVQALNGDEVDVVQALSGDEVDED
jgi:hypothetical protein